MNKTILENLSFLEGKYQYKTLLACETGSRAYGTNNTMSDYDVRCIFVQPVRTYLQLGKKREVLNKVVASVIELNGWDLFKTLDLFVKSNPSVYETLFSPIVYLEDEDIITELRTIAKSSFSLKTMSHHYHNMVKSNLEIIREKELAPKRLIKTLLQAVRGLLMLEYIVTYKELPPLRFETLVANSKCSNQQKNDLQDLLQLKINDTLIGIDGLKGINKLATIKLQQLTQEIDFLPHSQVDRDKVNQLIWNILEV